MIDVNLKALVGRLNEHTTQALNGAVGATVARSHYEVQVEHLLGELLGDPGNDVRKILDRFEIDPRRVKAACDGALGTFKSGNSGRPVFSPWLVEWLQDAWTIGSVDFGQARIRSGLLLATLVLRKTRVVAPQVAEMLGAISTEALRKELLDLIATSHEQPRIAEGEGQPGAAPPPGDGTALTKFCEDLTAKAKAGKIDPIFGRDREIRQMIDILARRRKNNPILVGEPGVGKTAVIEGFALMIAEGTVPQAMKDVAVLSLDVGALSAGAGVRGEFENRLKAVIGEVQASPKPIILFIDEAHTLIGAGGGAGSAGDAANLLKPALARGELRTIAATTWKEYKKYFEKDPALARRFELVKVPEPPPELAVGMLRGVVERYARSHGVHVRDDAVIAAVNLSHRYITGRQLPDKAVGLLDTCAARVKISQSAAPSELLELRAKLGEARHALAAHEADLVHATGAVEDRREALRTRIDQLETDAAQLQARWEQERDAVGRVLELRARATGPEGDDVARASLRAAVAELHGLQAETPLVHAEVDEDAVARVVADWTGIPVGKVVKDEASAVVRFESEMKRRVKGQDHALEVIGEAIRQTKAGLHDPTRPQGVFLLVGPSGVGKTETATGVADLLYGGERSMVTINMSEFQEKHTVSRLVGSPPGYVGFGEGGILTEAVRQRPYSVVLLDECEKADPEVLNLFYQVFDKGELNDGEGREVDFRNTMIILTSNLATAEITATLHEETRPHHEELVARIRPILSRFFKPALLARMTIVPYFPLPQDTLRSIAELKLGKVAKRLADQHRVALTWEAEVPTAIAARCTEVETGARNVDHILRGSLLPVLSKDILARIGTEDLPPELRVRLDAAGHFAVDPVRAGEAP